MTARVRADAVPTREATVLRLRGALDLEGVAETAPAFEKLAAAPPSSGLLVLDLREVEVLADEGLRALHTFATALAGSEVEVRFLVAPGSEVERELGNVAGAGPEITADVLHALRQDPEDTGLGDPRLGEQFEDLTRTLLTAVTVVGALERIVEATRLVVPHADLVSITLRAGDGHYTTPVETDPIASGLDQVQYRSGRGPCVDAADPAGPAYAESGDLRTEPRWPEFAAAAAGHGLRAIIATSLLPFGDAEPAGALNVYSRRTDGFTPHDRTLTLLLATHASLALAHSRSAELADLRDAQFRRAVASRDVIGQAKGILMTRQGISADAAFGLLRHASQDLNVKLVDLATRIATEPAVLDPPASEQV